MVLEIVMPHILPMAMIIYYKSIQWYDRHGGCDSKRSRKIIQSEYEELYIGPEIVMDSRLAQIIACTWVTMTYCIGLPILFLISAINFTLIYWVDKWLILRFYRTPKNFDDRLIRYSIKYLKIGVIFHVLIGFAMLSNK